MRLASELTRLTRANPSSFSALATEHSDDRVSRNFGGYLGIVAVADLPSTLLDALDALGVDQSSGVVESAFGFHVLQRHAIAAQQQIAARRIVISHSDVPDGAGEKPSTRSRAEASILIQQLHTTLQRHPDKFAEFARRYSDTSEAANGGEIGQSSNYEGGERNLGLRLIESSQVGELSAPFETALGYQIYQRSPYDSNPALLADYIAFESSDATRESSTAAEQLAQRVASELAERPEMFDVTQRRQCSLADCSSQRLILLRHRSDPQAFEVVERLRVGQVAKRPVALRGTFLVVRRGDANALADESEFYETEMPQVDVPSALDQLAALDAETLRNGTLKLMSLAEERLSLTREQHSKLRELFEDLAARLATVASDKRSEVIAQHRAKVLALLGPTNMASLQELRESLWHQL